MSEIAKDPWSQWLLDKQQGSGSAYRHIVLEDVERYRDRVLDGAGLAPGMTLVDVGSGEGLIGFGAIARVGHSLRVVFTDVSATMLAYAKKLASENGVRGQCVFIEGAADKLEGIADSSIDVVTSRAVLANVADKPAALREFNRILKPGGRISIAEPVIQDDAFETAGLGRMIEARSAHPHIEFLRLLHRFKSLQFPSSEEEIARSPITNYSERDLFRFARDAGFVDVHMELHIDARPSLIRSWEVFLDVAPHPWAPTPREILAEKFNKQEQTLFEKFMRAAVESPSAMSNERTVYLTGAKRQ